MNCKHGTLAGSCPYCSPMGNFDFATMSDQDKFKLIAGAIAIYLLWDNKYALTALGVAYYIYGRPKVKDVTPAQQIEALK